MCVIFRCPAKLRASLVRPSCLLNKGSLAFLVCLFLWTPSFEGIRYPDWDFAYVRGWRRW